MLLEAVPASERVAVTQVPFAVRSSIARGDRQKLLDRLAGQYLVVSTCECVRVEDALKTVRRDETVRYSVAVCVLAVCSIYMGGRHQYQVVCTQGCSIARRQCLRARQ